MIIDSQPLTVAVLAALFFGESIGYVGAAGLVLGVVGLLLLEVTCLETLDPPAVSLLPQIYIVELSDVHKILPCVSSFDLV